MAQQRAQGEAFTIDELFPHGFGEFSTNKIGKVERLHSLLDPLSSWMIDNPLVHINPQSTNVPPEWVDLHHAVDGSTIELDKIVALLHVPDRDYGDSLRWAKSKNPSFVKKRSLVQQLVAMVMIELHRGRFDRALEIYNAALRWPEWHAAHKTLVNQMIRVAMSNLLLDAQWSMLAHSGWSDDDLQQWQRHWSTNVLVGEFSQFLRVERAQAFEMFDSIRTNGATGLGKLYGKSGVFEKVAGKVWSFGLADADQLFYAENIQGCITANLKGEEQQNYRVVDTEVGRIMADVDRKIGSFHGSFFMVSAIVIPPVDRANAAVFKYEVHREMAVAALALHRFQRKHGHYPDDLRVLSTDFSRAGARRVDGWNGFEICASSGRRIRSVVRRSGWRRQRRQEG